MGADEGPMGEIRALIHKMGMSCHPSSHLMSIPPSRSRTNYRWSHWVAKLGESLDEHSRSVRMGWRQSSSTRIMVSLPSIAKVFAEVRLLPDWLPFAPWRWVRV